MKDRSIGGEAGKKEMKIFFILSLIVVLGFLIRTYIWFRRALQDPDGIIYRGDNYLDAAKTLVFNSQSFIESYYVARPIYPLYLTPIYIFGLKEGSYIFWLHHGEEYNLE